MHPWGKIPRQTDRGQSLARPGWLGQASPCEYFFPPANGADCSGFWCIIDLSFKVSDLQITIKRSKSWALVEFVAAWTEFVEFLRSPGGKIKTPTFRLVDLALKSSDLKSRSPALGNLKCQRFVPVRSLLTWGVVGLWQTFWSLGVLCQKGRKVSFSGFQTVFLLGIYVTSIESRL